MKKILLCLIVLINILFAYAQTGYVNVEVFKTLPENIQTTLGAPIQTYRIDTLETQKSTELDRAIIIRGYLIPPETGYYKFYLATDPNSFFYLSTDSLEKNKSLLKKNSAQENYVWKTNLNAGDSIYYGRLLDAGKKYYFEVFCSGYYWNNSIKPWVKTLTKGNYIKIGWALPNSNKLQIISDSCLAPYLGQTKIPKIIEAEIFENKPNFSENTIQNLGQFDKRITIDSLYLPNNSTNKDNCISRIRGYLIPPKTGIYTFLLAADDKTVFNLSSNEFESQITQVLSVDSIQIDWTKNTTQVSLDSGKYYYFDLFQYDSVGADYLKLGWIVPEDTIAYAIKSDYITNTIENISTVKINFKTNNKRVLPNTNFIPDILFTPWNSKKQVLQWYSSNFNIASVNADGIVTSLTPGLCKIICRLYSDTTIADTLYIHVINNNGAFFVKQNASKLASGSSWDDAIDLQTVLNNITDASLPKKVSIYVAEGTYYPTETIDKTISITLQNVNIYGGFDSLSTGIDLSRRNLNKSITTFSGNIGDKNSMYDNSFHVVLVRDSVEINGISITDGRACSSTFTGGSTGFYTLIRHDNGGGILCDYTKSTNTSKEIKVNLKLNKCRIHNNYAWNGGAGFSSPWQLNSLTVDSCVIENNKIEQVLIQTGQIFYIKVNGFGAGMVILGNKNIKVLNSIFKYNHTTNAYGASILASCNIDINNCTFYENTGYCDFLNQKSNAITNINNSTFDNPIWIEWASSTCNFINSTSKSQLRNYTSDIPNIKIDNSIVLGLDSSYLKNPSVKVTNSIIKQGLISDSTNFIIRDSLPQYTEWLDTLAFNGGFTPTMRLKDVPFNPAKSFGNPLYLDSLDQRGYKRTDTVSIGAYQWIYPTSFQKSINSITLFEGDSIPFTVSILPIYAEPDSVIYNLNNETILSINESSIIAKNIGSTYIFIKTIKGNVTDSILVNVTKKEIPNSLSYKSQNSITVYPIPCANELTIQTKDEKIKNFIIYNTLGEIIYLGSCNNQTIFNTQFLKNGIYYIKFNTGEFIQFTKQ